MCGELQGIHWTPVPSWKIWRMPFSEYLEIGRPSRNQSFIDRAQRPADWGLVKKGGVDDSDD